MAHIRSVATPQQAADAKYRNWDATDFAPDTDEADSPYDIASIDTDSDGFAPSEAELTPFKDLIQRDPVVCDHCFLRRYEAITREWWRGSFGWMEYRRWIPVPDTCVPIPADQPAQGTRLACKNCGHQNSKHRPVSKEDIESFAENISRTLDFKGIAHDCEVLLLEVNRRNTSVNQGRQDSHVFAPAVREAIRAEQWAASRPSQSPTRSHGALSTDD